MKNSDLYKKHDQLIELKKSTYDKVFVRCQNTIKLAANAGELVCLFEVPGFLFGSGYPLINVESCANYIMNKLVTSNRNIKTTFIEPNLILIDWRRDKDIVVPPNSSKFGTTDFDSDTRSETRSETRSDVKYNIKSETKSEIRSETDPELNRFRNINRIPGYNGKRWY